MFGLFTEHCYVFKQYNEELSKKQKRNTQIYVVYYKKSYMLASRDISYYFVYIYITKYQNFFFLEKKGNLKSIIVGTMPAIDSRRGGSYPLSLHDRLTMTLVRCLSVVQRSLPDTQIFTKSNFPFDKSQQQPFMICFPFLFVFSQSGLSFEFWAGGLQWDL